MELMQIQHYKKLQEARSIRQISLTNQKRFQQQQREVIVITNERDQLKAMIAQAE
jgi:hypothetical protein